MGRIKTKFVKRVTHDLMIKNPNKFTTNFEFNKKVVDELLVVYSKKLRNIIAGYATRLVKNK